MEEFEAYVQARSAALARTAYLLTGDVRSFNALASVAARFADTYTPDLDRTSDQYMENRVQARTLLHRCVGNAPREDISWAYWLRLAERLDPSFAE